MGIKGKIIKETPTRRGTLAKGSVVFVHPGCTYGCITSGIAVTSEDGKLPFFVIPEDSVEWE